jgi:hypothetical protein
VASNKQLQRTVTRRRVRAASAPFHYALAARVTRHRAAAELRRYAAPRTVSQRRRFLPILWACFCLGGCDPVWLVQREISSRVPVTDECARQAQSRLAIDAGDSGVATHRPGYTEYWVAAENSDSVSAVLDAQTPHKIVLYFGSKSFEVPAEFERTRALLTEFQSALVGACGLEPDGLEVRETCVGSICDSPRARLHESP